MRPAPIVAHCKDFEARQRDGAEQMVAIHFTAAQAKELQKAIAEHREGFDVIVFLHKE